MLLRQHERSLHDANHRAVEGEGHPARLVTVEKWRRGLNALAATMDEVLASHLAQLKNGPLSW